MKLKYSRSRSNRYNAESVSGGRRGGGQTEEAAWGEGGGG